MQGINQDKLCDYDGSALEIDCLPGVVSQIFDIEQAGVSIGRYLGHEPLKVSKERGVIKSPFRGFLGVELEANGHMMAVGGRGRADFIVPLLDGQGVREGQPVAMDLEVG